MRSFWICFSMGSAHKKEIVFKDKVLYNSKVISLQIQHLFFLKG